MNKGRSGAKLTMTLCHVTLQCSNSAPREYDILAASPQEAASRIMWEGWTMAQCSACGKTVLGAATCERRTGSDAMWQMEVKT